MSIFGSPATSFTSVFSGGAGTLASSALNTAIGDFIVACVFGSGLTGGTTISLADLAGNTYTARPFLPDAGGGQGFRWFYCIATAAHASNVITATFSAGTVVALGICKFPITGGTPAFDVDTGIQLNTNVTNPAVSPAFNATGADEVILAVLADGGTEPTFTAGTGYTLVNSSGLSFPRQRMEYGVFASPGSGVSASFPFTGSGVANSVTAIAFKAAGGGGAAAAPVVCIMQ